MCVALAYVNSPQRMRQRYAYGSNIAAVRCGWEDRIMSNRESKIAESKARLCCGFAIALRALFLGIVCFVVGDSLLVDCFASARNDNRILKNPTICHCEHSQECEAINRHGIPTRSIATLMLLARNDKKSDMIVRRFVRNHNIMHMRFFESRLRNLDKVRALPKCGNVF